MNPRSKTLCVFLALLMGVFFLSPHTYGAEPGPEAKVAWLTEHIADYLQVTTGEIFGESFRDMVATILGKHRERAEDAPWYQALDKAYEGCGAASQEPDNEELQNMCKTDTNDAIQEALRILATMEGLPPQLVSVFYVARGETPPAEPERERPILDPQTSEQEHYYEEGREVSPSQ